jgi:signal transduction histidine kinase
LTIANTSQEILPADLPRLFERFFQVEKSRSQSFGGSGLGLTIAKRIVELHGGSIEVQNRDGWTTFSVTLS